MCSAEMGLKLIDQMGMVNVGRYGDEESTLLDRYERLSFEVHLNQAILGRSLSHPTIPSPSSSSWTNYSHNSSSLVFPQLSSTSPSHPPHSPHHHVNPSTADRRRPLSTFMRVVKKLFTPIFGASASAPPSTTTKRVKEDCKLRKPFSRSLRA